MVTLCALESQGAPVVPTGGARGAVVDGDDGDDEGEGDENDDEDDDDDDSDGDTLTGGVGGT